MPFISFTLWHTRADSCPRAHVGLHTRASTLQLKEDRGVMGALFSEETLIIGASLVVLEASEERHAFGWDFWTSKHLLHARILAQPWGWEVNKSTLLPLTRCQAAWSGCETLGLCETSFNPTQVEYKTWQSEGRQDPARGSAEAAAPVSGEAWGCVSASLGTGFGCPV